MDNEVKQKILEYGQYLDEIRKKTYVLAVALLLFFIIGFSLTGKILSFVISLLKIKDITIATTSPFQFINLAVNTGIFIAILFCLPLAIYYFYDFIKDALINKERKFFLTLIPVGCVLFLVGFTYGVATLYFALKIIAQINISLGIANLWDISKFLSEIVITSAFLGLIFEFPVVITFLIRADIINLSLLKSKRRHAYAFIFIFVSLLPPTDGLSLIIMSLPLLVIYEATILINSLYKSQKILINY
jgi:sec-independent protein translocase protein TatC